MPKICGSKPYIPTRVGVNGERDSVDEWRGVDVRRGSETAQQNMIQHEHMLPLVPEFFFFKFIKRKGKEIINGRTGGEGKFYLICVL